MKTPCLSLLTALLSLSSAHAYDTQVVDLTPGGAISIGDVIVNCRASAPSAPAIETYSCNCYYASPVQKTFKGRITVKASAQASLSQATGLATSECRNIHGGTFNAEFFRAESCQKL